MASVHISDNSQFQVVNRVSQYSSVNSIIETSKVYYNSAKESSSIVAFADTKFGNVLDSDVYNSYAKPLLLKVDNLAVSTLDQLENGSKSIYTNSTHLIEDAGKLVGPVDTYLKDSLVGKPFNLALDITEKVADRFLLENDDKQLKETDIGPLYRTAYLSKKVHQQALAKLNSFRTSENTTLGYTVELIHFAKKSLDNGFVSIGESVHKQVENVKELPQKARDATADAVAAVHAAVDEISKRIPPEVLAKLSQFKDSAIVLKIGEGEAGLLTQVVNTSSRLLHEAGTTISTYVSKGEVAPQQILHATYTNLTKVLHNLIAILDRSSDESETPSAQ